MQRKNYTKEALVHDASALSVGIVVSDFNSDITHSMLAGALETLRAWKVQDTKIETLHVPGGFEIPFGCLQLLSKKKKPDVIIALGCVIKGDTDHDQYIAYGVTKGIMDLMLRFNTPIAFGVLTTNNLAQARLRSRGKANKGSEAVVAGLSSALLKK